MPEAIIFPSCPTAIIRATRSHFEQVACCPGSESLVDIVGETRHHLVPLMVVRGFRQIRTPQGKNPEEKSALQGKQVDETDDPKKRKNAITTIITTIIPLMSKVQPRKRQIKKCTHKKTHFITTDFLIYSETT